MGRKTMAQGVDSNMFNLTTSLTLSPVEYASIRIVLCLILFTDLDIRITSSRLKTIGISSLAVYLC